MNIAMFTDSYKPQINGLVTSLDLFTKKLRERKNKVYIFAPDVKETKKENFVFRFKSFTFRSYKEYRVGIPYSLILDPEIKNIKFDIVHVHSPFSLGLAGIAFAKYYKIPIIGTFHTLFPDYMHYVIKSEKLQRIKLFKYLFKLGSWKYLSWFYNHCDIVIAPSENIKKVLRKNGFKKKIIVIPTGVKIESKRKIKKHDLRKKYNLGNEKIILHVGRITKEKNIKFIIKSLKNILKNENIKFVITSDGPYKNELKKYVNNLGLSNKIIFTGYLSNKELNDFYKLSDVFVMASKSETQGLVLVEAAINKLPIVVLDVPVISDFVKENSFGIVSKKKDFSKNINLILNNNLIRKKILKNYKIVAKKYDIEKCTNQLLNIYRNAQHQYSESDLCFKK
ncbi:MAG: glycosyltransferase [Candidatus Aenigmatarchaeota archaeon]